MMKKARTVEIPDDRILTQENFYKLLDHAYKSSLWYVTTYNRNSYQTREKLLRKGYVNDDVVVIKDDGTQYTSNIIDETLQKLEEALILDDNSYMESFVLTSLDRGLSFSAMKTKLIQSGFPRVVVEKELEKYDSGESQDDALDKAGSKIIRSSSFQKLDYFKKKQKIIRTLASKGFPLSDIYKWIDENVEGESTW